MKALPLFACLALLAAQTRAETVPAASGSAPAATPAPVAERGEILAEIDSWHAQFAKVVLASQRTAETDACEKNLGAIRGKVAAAQNAGDLDRALKEFRAWQETVVMNFGAMKQSGAPRGSAEGGSSNSERLQTLGKEAAQISSAQSHQTDAQFFDGGGARPAAVAANPANADGRPPLPDAHAVSAASPAPGLRIHTPPAPQPTPPPAPSAKKLSWRSLRDYVDSKGISVTTIERLKEKGRGRLDDFKHFCYRAVKKMMAVAGMLPSGVQTPDQIGIGSSDAYMLSRDLKKNPRLQKLLGIRLLDLTTVADADVLPERTILVFDRGCAGFSRRSGHIEYTVSQDKIPHLPRSFRRRYDGRIGPNDVVACSDGCMPHTKPYLRFYGRTCLNAYVPVIPGS